jgi:S-adenosylmethionine hydrolase
MRNFGPVITFTSDFGTTDGYTGAVKGVILSINPQATIVDISHQIDPFNVTSASWIIASAYKYFPAGTIHIVAVDPSVGSDQRRILVQGDREIFIAPDNGVLTNILREQSQWKAYELNKKEYWLPYVSNTFHTRDIFAPVAAHISLGVDIKDIGTAIDFDSLAKLAGQELETDGNKVKGAVVHVDRFGNLITNIPNDKIRTKANCFLGDQSIGTVSSTRSGVEKGQTVAFPASHGYLEIAIHHGRAAEKLNAKVGHKVSIESKAAES